MVKPSELTIEQIEYATQVYNDGGNISALAREYGVKRESLRSYLDRAKVAASETEQALDQQVSHDRQVERYRAEANRAKKLYTRSIRLTSTQDMMVESLRETVQALPVLSPAGFITKPSERVSGTHTAVLQGSDWHVGEVVDREVMGGLGEYNLTIFRERMGLLLETVINLVDLRRSRLDIPRLVILLDGDMVSGDALHDELTRTNQVNIMDQTTQAAVIGAHVIAQFSQYFEEIEVSCTVGNHGRNQRRPEYKETYVNWDYICYQLMAQMLLGYENVKFDIPKSKWQITKIENVEFLHFHGDGIKGWAGFPWYGVSRAIKSLRESLIVGDYHFDAVAMGHFHVPLRYESPTGPWFVNGCVKGGDEFALSGLHTTVRPIQNLFFVHSGKGVLGDEPIYLDGNQPKHAEHLPGTINDTWATQVV